MKQKIIPLDLFNAFEQAMAQWKMYMTDFAGCDLDDMDNLESIKYYECLDVLKKYKEQYYEKAK